MASDDMSIVGEILDWIGIETTESVSDGYPERHVERWCEYEVRDPTGHAAAHEETPTCHWTCAPGIWTCDACGRWYRTWEDDPEVDPRQGGVISR